MSFSTFEKELDEHGYICITNVGTSMLPLIRQGKDVMIIEKKQSRIKKYDAVLYVRPGAEGRGRYILHRVLKVLPDNNFFIAGDNCTGGEIVNGEQIIGVLKSVNRDGTEIKVTDKKYKKYVIKRCRFYRLRFFVLKCRNFIFNFKLRFNSVLHKAYLFYKKR